jgi:hypothetical protein
MDEDIVLSIEAKGKIISQPETRGSFGRHLRLNVLAKTWKQSFRNRVTFQMLSFVPIEQIIWEK